RKLDALERKYDARFKAVFDAIRQLMSPPAAGRRAIGFRARACGDNVGRLRPKPNLRSQAHQGPLRGETRRGPYPLLLFGLCAPLEVLEGLRQLSLLSERQAQVGVGKGIVRLDAQGLLEMFDRLGKLALLGELNAPVGVGKGVARLDAQSLPIVIDGLGRLALTTERRAPVGVGDRIVRLDAQGLPIVVDRLGEFALAIELISEVILGDGRVRVNCKGMGPKPL